VVLSGYPGSAVVQHDSGASDLVLESPSAGDEIAAVADMGIHGWDDCGSG
jgi:hypothetical protein